MSDKKILISGKEIDYGNMSDEMLLNLYNQLIKRQKNIRQKIKEYEEKK